MQQFMAKKLVLASTSPYRRELLARLGLAFEVANPRTDETPHPSEAPEETARRLSEAKARAVADAFPGALIIGSDQVAVMDGRVFGKPGTHARAVEQLEQLAGKTVNRPVEMYLLAAVVYFVICFSLSMLVRRLQKKIQIIR